MGDIRVGIVGVTGYTGIELARLLARHPEAVITYLSSESQGGNSLMTVFPHLTGADLPELEVFDPVAAVEECDALFLARGNGWAMQHASELITAGAKLIDLAADFRLADPALWMDFYGHEHQAKGLLDEAVYGIPELHRTAIEQARIVANPGCYPTSAILALAPAVAGQWIESSDIIISSTSGVSGAGRSRTETAYLFSEVNDNYRAYNVTKHRHTPEIEQELSGLAGEALEITFTPHLAPMTRGIHTTAYAHVAPEAGEDDIRQAYLDFYADAPFVQITEPGEWPETKQVAGTNFCRICPIVIPRTGRLVVLSVIDNLVKGAAGQAVQNFNLMFGLDETLGLNFPGIYT